MREEFCNQLHEIIEKAPQNEELTILGDFNAFVGNETIALSNDLMKT